MRNFVNARHECASHMSFHLKMINGFIFFCSSTEDALECEGNMVLHIHLRWHFKDQVGAKDEGEEKWKGA